MKAKDGGNLTSRVLNELRGREPLRPMQIVGLCRHLVTPENARRLFQSALRRGECTEEGDIASQVARGQAIAIHNAIQQLKRMGQLKISYGQHIGKYGKAYTHCLYQVPPTNGKGTHGEHGQGQARASSKHG